MAYGIVIKCILMHLDMGLCLFKNNYNFRYN